MKLFQDLKLQPCQQADWYFLYNKSQSLELIILLTWVHVQHLKVIAVLLTISIFGLHRAPQYRCSKFIIILADLLSYA